MKKVIPGKIKTQLRLDGYYNVLNKYGTQHDSTEYYQWASGSAVSDTELADLYAGNGLFSTIIDAPADDATKNGIDLGIKDKNLQKQLDNHLQTIRYQSKFAKALRWARLFGGAAVVMLVDDGRLLQDPLNWRDVHGVEELLVYGRNEMYPLWVNGYENNPDDEDYRRGGTGIPEYYQVNSVYGNYVVHSSRCLVFHNSDIPESSTMANLYRTWGIPEYLRIREELRNASIGPGYSIRLLERLSMVTYKMKNLAGVLSTADGEDTVLQRMEMLDLARNLLNMIIIDADGEDVGVQSLSVAGVKDILDNACAMLSAVSHIPQTRLFGRSPAGENATGESDLENYKEFVGGLQNGDLRDNTRTLVELILRGMVWNREVKEVPEYTVTYKSAWSPSDDEKAAQDQAAAAAQLTRAQTAGTYVTNGIVEAEEVRRAMVRDEQFDPENILTEADIHQDWGLGGADTQQEAADGQQQNVEGASGLVTDEGDCGYVAGFVLNDGKILCGRRSDGQGWCGPGGHIEPGETPGVAFRRETKEEFGVDVGNITYLGNCKGKPEEILPVQIYRVNDYGITADGFSMRRLDEIYNDSCKRFEDEIGVNPSENPQSLMNVLFTIFADAPAELWEAFAASYQQLFPNTAEGIALDNAMQIGGVNRIGQARTKYTLSCTGREGTVIPAGALVQSSTYPQRQFQAKGVSTISSANWRRIGIRPIESVSGTITFEFGVSSNAVRRVRMTAPAAV